MQHAIFQINYFCVLYTPNLHHVRIDSRSLSLLCTRSFHGGYIIFTYSHLLLLHTSLLLSLSFFQLSCILFFFSIPSSSLSSQSPSSTISSQILSSPFHITPLHLTAMWCHREKRMRSIHVIMIIGRIVHVNAFKHVIIVPLWISRYYEKRSASTALEEEE